ncbi:MAG: tetratricopeptide repeat protein [Myxococcales bacterium]|nr:tetratricopeptide repeat protein [Myxococcales bacterium]
MLARFPSLPDRTAAVRRFIAGGVRHCAARPGRNAVAVAVALASLAAPTRLWAADDVRPVELDIDNVRAQVTAIDADLKRAIAKEKRYPIEQGYFEAQLAYERGNLALASIRLMDLVNNPDFQKRSEYGDGLFLLGDCLFRQRNWFGARKYLDLVVRQPSNKHFQVALQELADIAARLHRIEEVEQYAKKLDAIPAGPRKSELFYQFGRSFFSAKVLDRAVGLLDQIPVGEPRWPNARFYIGAAHVARGRHEQAILEFQSIVAAAKVQDAARRPANDVLDFANVALGRLLMQAKKFDAAANHYRAVDRNSPIYEESLFELAALHVAAEKPQAALEVLDVLLLTVSDDNVAVQAAVLRGRINMLAKQYDQADAAYQDVVERYSSITGELTRFAASDKNLELFFSWLLNRASEEYTVVRPVSDRVAKYIETDEDMLRVVSLFDEMAVERRDVKESQKLATSIEMALKDTTLNMFPELKDSWQRVAESQNRVVEIGRRVTDLMRTLALPHMNGEERTKADVFLANRRRLEAAFSKIPATQGDFVLRQNRVDTGFANLSADVGILKANLEQVRQQLLSVEKMLNDRVFGEQGLVLEKAREDEIRAGLQSEKDNIRRVYREIEEATQSVEVDAQAVGAGDSVTTDENRIRLQLLTAQRVEHGHAALVLERTNRSVEDTARLQQARTVLDQLVESMSGLLTAIAARANDRIAGIATVLAQEKRNIAEYNSLVRNYEEDSKQLSRQVGYGMIRAAEKRLADILLEADLGRVDVAWQRKQQKSSAIRELQDERSQRIRSLGEVLNNLIGDSAEVEP